MATKQITPKTGLPVGSSGDSSKINANVSMNEGAVVNSLVQNLLNYKSGGTKLDKAFDLQKAYSPDGRALMTTGANGTNYEYPIGPVQPRTGSVAANTSNTTNTKNPALAYDPADVALAQASGAAKSNNGGVYGTPKTQNPNQPTTYYDNEIDAVSSAQPINYNNTGGNNGSNTGTPGNAVDGQPGGNGNTGNPGATTGGGGYNGGGYGGGGYGNISALLGQLGGGTGLVGIGGGGTGTPYVPVAQTAGANSAEAAAAYAQLLQNAGYDLSQPLTDIPLPNRVDLPQEIELPENFDFLNAWNNLPEVNVGRIDHVNTHPEEEMLAGITGLQSQQAILNANNTVNKGITELQRAMENAQDVYKTQQAQIAMDEARAKDNQVLYNEARGDRGGIGQAQYDTIQNTAATNRLTVQKEQTQLATDTARQVADLRAQGEFEKANQLLSISQKYLSELMDLYQWAKETNLSIDEFNLQVEQWEENFKLSLVGAELDADAFNLNLANARIDQENNLFNARFNQENALFDAMLNAAKFRDDEALARLNAQLNAANATGTFANGTPTYAATQDAIANQLKERSMLADIGTALIKAGIQPSEQILAAMGMGGTATGVAGGSLAGTPFAGMDATSVLRAMGVGNAGLAGIAALGYTPESFLAEALGVNTTSGLPALDASALSGATAMNALPSGGEQIYNQLSYEYPNYQNEIAAYTNSIVDEINNQIGRPNYSNPEVARYNSPSTLSSTDYYTPEVSSYSPRSSGYTDANVYAAFGADPETVLRAMGVGNDGMAGLAALGVTPAQFIGQAFGL